MWDDDLPDWFANEDDEAEEAGFEDEGDDGVAGSQHCLILVDCGSKGMFEQFIPDLNPEMEDQLSPVDVTFSAVEQLIREKIKTTMVMRTGQRDALGISLYNTTYKKIAVQSDEDEADQTKEMDDNDADEDEEFDTMGPGYSTVHEFIPLVPPGVDAVKAVLAFVGRQRDLEEEFARKKNEENDETQVPLQVALCEALEIYRSCSFVRKPKPGEPSDSKQIWIFTNDDNPCPEEALRIMQTTVNDVKENGIELVVWPLPKTNANEFDYSLFYDTIQATTPLRDYGSENTSLEAILCDMQVRWKKTRRAFAVPLLLPNWRDHPDRPGIALDVYRMILPGKTPAKVPIHQETGKALSRVRQTIAEGGELLIEQRPSSATNRTSSVFAPGGDRIRSYVTFGGEHVRMTPEDKVNIKKHSNANQEFASLILLGFRSDDSIPLTHALEQPYFAYPNDEKTAGSAAAFATIHASMHKKKVIAIGELLTRVSATSRLVAMFPLLESTEKAAAEGDEVAMLHPSGLMLVPLPFEDEMRLIAPDVGTQSIDDGVDIVTDAIVEAATALIEKQTLTDFTVGENLENAYLSRVWNYVEHVALELPLAEDKEYDTVVDWKEVEAHVKDEVAALVSVLPEDIIPEKKARKRKIEPDTSGVDWNDLYSNDALSDCKVGDLKMKLKSLGEKVSGKKADLIERLHPLLEKEFGKAIKTEDSG